jgi:hypothetical protein
LPYHWGGGHGSFSDSGYDCSGSVSFVLHAAGRLATPLASAALMSYGEPGPGRWITVYANGGHAYMVVNGRRFDTSGQYRTGSRWQPNDRSPAGYVARRMPDGGVRRGARERRPRPSRAPARGCRRPRTAVGLDRLLGGSAASHIAHTGSSRIPSQHSDTRNRRSLSLRAWRG